MVLAGGRGSGEKGWRRVNLSLKCCVVARTSDLKRRVTGNHGLAVQLSRSLLSSRRVKTSDSRETQLQRQQGSYCSSKSMRAHPSISLIDSHFAGSDRL
jgi:hypothetical protein